jgi:hypothetical protein
MRIKKALNSFFYTSSLQDFLISHLSLSHQQSLIKMRKEHIKRARWVSEREKCILKRLFVFLRDIFKVVFSSFIKELFSAVSNFLPARPKTSVLCEQHEKNGNFFFGKNKKCHKINSLVTFWANICFYEALKS